MGRNRALSSPPKLKGLDFEDAKIFKARDSGGLLMISPFVSSLCNLNCIYCYAASGRKLPNELTTQEYKDIVLQGKELGAKTVWIPGAGEPLLQEDFREIVEYINTLKMTLVMFTNSTHMTEEMARFLYKNNASVITKCNSFRKEVQDELAGRVGAFKEIQRGLKILLDAGFNKHQPTRLGIETIVCRQNYKEIPDIFRFARENNIFPYVELLTNSGRASGSNLDISNKQERELFYKLLAIDENEFGYTWKPVPPYVAIKCNKLFYNISVDSQGNVRPCCAISINVGNIREKSIKEILSTSETIQRIRHMDKNVGGNCKTCSIKKSGACYYGCRSQAYVDGDLFGAYNKCWVV